jgi:hypothetical protein
MKIVTILGLLSLSLFSGSRMGTVSEVVNYDKNDTIIITF